MPSSTSFWVENGKIVEHWGALHDVPEQPANDNTMFQAIREEAPQALRLLHARRFLPNFGNFPKQVHGPSVP